MWGISPRMNLLSGIDSEGSDAANILLLCPGDPGSVLATIAEASVKEDASKPPSRGRREVRFYIVEERPEALARHILLLHVFFDETVPIRQRAALYLEVFGNALVQDKTAAYLEEKGKSLVDFVLDGKEQAGTEGMFDLSLLKQRERDGLADVFASWRATKESKMMGLRDEILRNYYGVRYDCREGVIDWDYHAHIKSHASIVHPKQFCTWRMTGTAFEFGGAVYDTENRTLASPDELDSFARTGRGANSKMDVLTGPFIAHGIACDRSSTLSDGLFDVHNEGTGAAQHRYTAAHVALYNITSYMWQASTGERYQMRQRGDVLSGLGAGRDAPGPASPAEDDRPDASRRTAISLVFVRDANKKIFSKKKFAGFFDATFVSKDASSILQDGRLYEAMKRDATIAVETGRFDLSKNSSQKEEYIKDTREAVSKHKVEMKDGPDTFGQSLLTFKHDH